MNDSAMHQHRRQRQQHVAGESAVRRVDADLAENLEPLAHHVRQVLENLGEVAAGLTLNQHRGREEPDVEQRHAEREVVERVFHRQPEVLLVEGLPELRADRLVHLVGDHLQTGRKGMAGLQRAGNQIEPFGELLFERPHPLRPLDPQEDERHRETRALRRPASPTSNERSAPATSPTTTARPSAIRNTPLTLTLTPD